MKIYTATGNKYYLGTGRWFSFSVESEKIEGNTLIILLLRMRNKYIYIYKLYKNIKEFEKSVWIL